MDWRFSLRVAPRLAALHREHPGRASCRGPGGPLGQSSPLRPRPPARAWLGSSGEPVRDRLPHDDPLSGTALSRRPARWKAAPDGWTFPSVTGVTFGPDTLADIACSGPLGAGSPHTAFVTNSLIMGLRALLKNRLMNIVQRRLALGCRTAPAGFRSIVRKRG